MTISLTRQRLWLRPFFKINYLVQINLPTTLIDFQDFQKFHFLTKLKITEPIAQKFEK